MLSEKKILRTTISNDLLHLSLKRGSLLGGGGAFLLILGGTVIPLELMSLWGIPFFLLGILFISLGLLPYKKLARLQLFPHEIHIENSQLVFCRRGKPLFCLPLQNIETINFIEKEHIYGIGIWLKESQEKIKVFDKNFEFAAYCLNSSKRFEGCDLFFPYFTKRSFSQFKAQLE